LRRLGVGGAGAGGDRPIRAQLVVALVVGLILIAVPLYLWRRPPVHEDTPAASGSAVDTVVALASAAVVEVPETDPIDERVKLGPVQRVRCGASFKGQDANACEPLPFFDEALAKSIRDNVDCAPKTGKEGTINYVLSIDFPRKRLHVFAGQSGQWRGVQARKSVACVEKALPKPEWDTIRHQYRYYQIAILASYPGPQQIPGPKGAPVFE
jgi:hypothetical protein